LNRLAHLTPGDFAAIARQHRFRPLAHCEDVVQALEMEVSLKRHGVTRSIGFA
jgi:transitional endoplasmic reticulum ATPase